MKWLSRPLSKHHLFIIGIFLFAIIAHLAYLFPGGPSACHSKPLFLSIDEGTVLYDSFRITRGEVMYRDFFEFQGPVFYHIYAGLFALTGPSLTAARVFNLLATALTATLIALLVAQNLGRAAGFSAAAIHVCLLVPMYPLAYPQWLAEAFAFAGIYLLVTGYARASRDLASGICLGLCAFTVQSLGLPILGACMVTRALPGIAEHNWRASYLRPLRVFLGAAVSVSPFIIYLGIVGALDHMWYSTVEWVLKNYSEGQTDAMMRGYGAYLDMFLLFHKTVEQPWRTLATIGLQFVKFLPLFTICSAIVVIVRWLIYGQRRPTDYACLMLASACIAASSPLFFGITRVDIVHIAFLGSFGLCGAGVVLRTLAEWKPRLTLPIRVTWLCMAILVITSFGSKTVMTYGASREMKGWREEILKIGIADWVDKNVGPDERIVTAAYGGLQYLYIRRSAVGFTYLPFNTPKYYSDDQWRELGGQILKNLPPIVEVTEEQWLQISQRTPELKGMYSLVNNYFLMRKGFIPRN